MNNKDLMNQIDFPISIDTKRYEYNGTQVPRVTEILSAMLHSDALMMWANRIGLRGLKYQTELNRAAMFGTQAHKCIELYLKEKTQSKDNIAFLGYYLWEQTLIEKGIMIEPIMIEKKVTTPWYGGTLDAVLSINGRPFIIDFKTSNHVTFKYFLQLAAYSYALKEQENIDPVGVIVLQLDKKSPGFNEYLLDFKVPEHTAFMKQCIDCFFAILFAYYHTRRIETNCKELFGG